MTVLRLNYDYACIFIRSLCVESFYSEANTACPLGGFESSRDNACMSYVEIINKICFFMLP